jgi:hypothetical protein
MGKVCRAKGLCENVSDVVRRANGEDLHLIIENEVADRMVANVEMLYAGVPSLILGKLTRGVVIAIEGGWCQK